MLIRIKIRKTFYYLRSITKNNDHPCLNKPYNNNNYKFIESVNDKCRGIITNQFKKSLFENQTTTSGNIKKRNNIESFVSNKSNTFISTRNDNPHIKLDNNCLII